MSVFNSLGSNYSWSFVWRSLFGFSRSSIRPTVEECLNRQYGGLTTLTYKGREALQLALERSGLPSGSCVGINGFTCYVVYQAVENAGYVPVLIDVGQRQLNFDLDGLRSTHYKTPKLRAIIVQNTLGYPTDMPGLAAYCNQHGIMIIEDLAHSNGAVYSDGREVGTAGTMTMLSFSQDKPIDVVAGGALIDRRPEAAVVPLVAPYIGRWQRQKDRSYPFWTALIRNSYSSGAGRLLHAGLKRLKWLATPMNDDLQGLHQINPGALQLLLNQLNGFKAELQHRREIAAIYTTELSAELLAVNKPFGRPAFLRFPVIVNEREQLINYLRKQSVYIGDTWYDAPIAPKRYLAQTSYQFGQCPRAEQLAQQIINLPTHRQITPKIAREICARINQWQRLKLEK